MKTSGFIYDNRYKILKTLCCYVTYFCLGSCITLVGSSLLDLQIRVGTDFATVSYAIPIRSTGHIIGSVAVGIVGSRFSNLAIICLSSIATGIFVAIAPFFTQFYYLVTALFIAGIAQGITEIACNSLLASIWKEKSANWFQILHMSWGVGALIIPVIARSFLLPNTDEDTKSMIHSNLTHNESSKVPMNRSSYTAEDVVIQYAYLITAIFTMIMGIPFGCFYLKEKKASNALATTKVINTEDTKQNYSLVKVYTAVTLVSVISHLAYAIETLVGSLGPSFAVKSDLHMEKKTGVLLTTVFWSCFSFYRLIFIPMTFVVSETKLLLSSMIITLTGLVITVPWANSNVRCIWAGFTLMGIGISPMFSAAFGMMAKYINVTSRISSIIFVPSVLGESIHPAIAATFIASNPIICLYYLGVIGILLLLCYLTLIIYCSKAFNPLTDMHHREVSIRSSIRSISRY